VCGAGWVLLCAAAGGWVDEIDGGGGAPDACGVVVDCDRALAVVSKLKQVNVVLTLRNRCLI